MTYQIPAEIEEEAPRVMWRRRLQQRRCLVCGSRALANHLTSYFCERHISTHKYCSICETLRETDAHGRDSRCKGCASTKALAAYHADPDRCIYRIRLRGIAKRTHTRGDQIFAGIRRRIALADLVLSTPGMSWPRRAAIVGLNHTQLAASYREQVSGLNLDPDAADRMKTRRRNGR